MYILQNDTNKEEIYYFDNEFELTDWVDDNIEYPDRCIWTMIDPDGKEWSV
jgi:hypothetical protein